MRRTLLLSLLCAVAFAAGAARSDEAKPPAPQAAPAPKAAPAPEVVVPMDRLMTIGPLPDIVQGPVSAPVTIVEYASMTCSHCAAFHQTTWPALKSKYVETGQVRFVLREFPLDPLAAAAFMLARCAGPDKRNLVVDRLFAEQKTWAFVEKPVAPLFALAEGLGFSQDDFETCLSNQSLYDQVIETRERAAQAFQIDATPTFFVNGRKLTGELTLDEVERAIAQAKP